jgi:cbb3-type cytochrome oxidase subunit 3
MLLRILLSANSNCDVAYLPCRWDRPNEEVAAALEARIQKASAGVDEAVQVGYIHIQMHMHIHIHIHIHIRFASAAISVFFLNVFVVDTICFVCVTYVFWVLVQKRKEEFQREKQQQEQRSAQVSQLQVRLHTTRRITSQAAQRVN